MNRNKHESLQLKSDSYVLSSYYSCILLIGFLYCSPKNNGLVNDCTKNRNGEQQQNGIMIKRNSEDFQTAYNKAFEWSSYLAKEHTKQHIPGIRNFGNSKT